MMLEPMIIIAASLVVVARCIAATATLSLARWRGHRMRFVIVSVSIALMAVGAAGIAFGQPVAPYILLVGIAMHMAADRRRIA